MAKWAKRTAALLAAVLVLAGVGLLWLRTRLPDTFMVPRGQQLSLAQMPWLTPQEPHGASSAGATGPEGSQNTTLALWGMVPVKTVRTVPVDRRAVTVCGTPFGIKMFSEGALVVGFTDIRTANGYANPAKEAGVKLGDLLVSIDGMPTHSNEDVMTAIQKSAGEPVSVIYCRGGAQNTVSLTPVADETSGKYRAGMWVRDSSAGIGTMTFADNAKGVYGGLGHSISDADTGERITLRTGEAVPVTITGYVVGEAGSPGELKGSFSSSIAVGNILRNGASGVYGKLRTVVIGQDMTVAQAQEVKTGPAKMITTIAGTEPKAYDVSIERISMNEQDPNRNMVVRVTDPELLQSTGGIVQGMSGSPIVQEGQLVGAVTHVLVNDPTRGFAIFAETMLETADAVLDGAA